MLPYFCMKLEKSVLLSKFSQENLMFKWPLWVIVKVTWSMFTGSIHLVTIQMFLILNKYSIILGHNFNRNSCIGNLLNMLQRYFFTVSLKQNFKNIYRYRKKIFVFRNSFRDIVIILWEIFFFLLQGQILPIKCIVKPTHLD